MSKLSLLIFALAFMHTTFGQTAYSDRNCTISGRVVRASDGAPLKNAQVLLAGSAVREALNYSSDTDADGGFEFRDVKPGRYHLFARKVGFVSQSYRAQGLLSEGVIIALDHPGETIRDVLFRLVASGVVVGRVLDDFGEPVAGVEVQALTKIRANVSGLEILPRNRDLVAVREAITDDQGEYRVYGLPPGEYCFSATDLGDPDITDAVVQRGAIFTATGLQRHKYPRIFYPGVFKRSQAAQIYVRAGDEVRIDFQLQSQKFSTVSGRVVDTGSQPSPGAVISFQGRESAGSDFSGITSSDGRFQLRNVSPGRYIVWVQSTVGERPETDQQEIEVGGEDINGLELVLKKPITLRGKVTNANTSLRREHAMIVLQPADELLDFGYANLDSDNTFAIQNLHESTYSVRAKLPEGYYLESVRLGNKDILQEGLSLTPEDSKTPLEIAIGRPTASLEGTVYDGDEIGEASIVHLSPETPSPYRPDLSRTTVTDQNGRFLFENVTPSKYEVSVAEPDLRETADPHADSSEPAASIRVTLGKGERKIVVLKIRGDQNRKTY